MKILLATAALASLLAAPMAAQADTALGILTCKSDGATGYIIGSSENVICDFVPANAAQATEVYTGTLDNIGLDIGVTGETVMSWNVLADTDAYQPSQLAGTYVGASADASFAAGGGVKLLTGGPNGGLSLQPLSVQAQEGVNAALGVTKFTLVSASPAGAVVAPAGTVAVPAGSVVVPEGTVVTPQGDVIVPAN
jgi:hypothetical protein